STRYWQRSAFTFQKAAVAELFTCLSDLDSYRLVLLRNVFCHSAAPALCCGFFGFASIGVGARDRDVRWQRCLERVVLSIRCTATKLSRIPSVWDARRCANGSNDSDLRTRRCIAKRILRLSRLCSMLELSIMAAQRSETVTKQEVEVMRLCLQTLCNSAAD